LLAGLNIDFDRAGLKQYFNAVFAVDHHPLAFQFWFVRDLFLTVLLSPLLWLLLKRVPYAGGAALFSAWLFNYDLEIFFRPDVIFFFYAGALIRLKRVEIGITVRSTVVLCSLYLVLVTARALAPAIFDEATPLLAGFTRLMRLVGVLACWGLFLRLAEMRVGAILSRWGPFAFFLYAAHFPLMAELKLILWDLLPEVNDFWMVAHYLISVFLTIVLCLGAATLLARYVPGVFGLLNGGRVPSLEPRPVGPAATMSD
jgi:succinoglycan biosynthesis protein ExoH